MLKSYLTTAWRNIRKNKVFSFINVIGLSIGMAACLLILQYVNFELSYDQFNKNAADLYRVCNDRYRRRPARLFWKTPLKSISGSGEMRWAGSWAKPLPTSGIISSCGTALITRHCRPSSPHSAKSSFFPGNLFDYYFLDEKFNRQHENDQLFGKAFIIFAGFAIFIACLGLLGLALFATAQRRKEIGVRKVLGASGAGSHDCACNDQCSGYKGRGIQSGRSLRAE